ncbi:MAG: ABC transporter ATP-binding protein [Thermotogota bacterium]
MDIAIKTTSLNKSFGDLQVIEDLNIAIMKSERVAFLGPSGCGKTTLLRSLSGLLTDYNGQVERRYSQAGFVFQEPRLIPWSSLFNNLSFVTQDEERINRPLKLVELQKFKNHHPSKLSGGMQQRANLARALIVEPDIIFFDEPFQNLDLKSNIKLMEAVKRIQKEQKWTAVLVTHGIREAIVFAQRIFILSKGPARVVKEIDLTLEEETEFFSPRTAELERMILDYYE